MTNSSRSGDVVLAYVHSNEVAYSWHASLVDLVMHDVSHDRRLSHRIAVKCSSGGLVEARNQCAAEFLAGPGDWLFILDTDMGFAPDTLDRLLQVADPTSRPVVGALCFAWLEAEPDGLGGYRCGTRPTVFQFHQDETGRRVFAAVSEYPADAVVPVAATGSACIVWHRSVLEAIAAEYGPTWYDRIPAPAESSDGRALLSEDISACARAGAVGAPVHVHTGVATNHQKTTWIGPADHPPSLNLDQRSRVNLESRSRVDSSDPIADLEGELARPANRAERRRRRQ
jgi:hypothetical protein